MIAPILMTALAALSPASVSRVALPSVPVEQVENWVPFDQAGGSVILFSMMLNGKPVTALLDTGCGFSVVDGQTAARLAIGRKGAMQVEAQDSRVAMATTEPVALAVGHLELADRVILMSDLGKVSQAVGRRIDMLLGRDVLTVGQLIIDFDHKRFRFARSGAEASGVELPLLFTPGRQDVYTRLPVDGAGTVSVNLDTGFDGDLALGAGAWQGASMAGLRVTDMLVMGLGGRTTIRQLAMAPVLPVAGVGVADVAMQLSTDRYEAKRGLGGAIGIGLLQRFNPTFDFHSGSLFLAPRSRLPAPAIRSTSGLQMTALGDRLRVEHVMAGGPAAASGQWKAGDLICAVDGQAIMPDYHATPLHGWSTGKPGRVVRLDLCDGSVRSLRLERFY